MKIRMVIGILIGLILIAWITWQAIESTTYNRGMSCLQQGNYRQAVTEFTTVLKLSPKDIGAISNRGSAYDYLNDFPHAKQDFNAAIHLATQQKEDNAAIGELYFNRAVMYGHFGHTAEAIADYRNAIRLKPQIEDAYLSLAFALATKPDATREDGLEAVKYATTECKQTNWKNPEALDALAAALARTGAFDDATKWEKKAIALDSDAQDQKDYQERQRLYEAHMAYTDTKQKPSPLGPGKVIH